ncbi:hypothetical protein Droror1_Dr00025209, partial [Drosera rotundifolia]
MKKWEFFNRLSTTEGFEAGFIYGSSPGVCGPNEKAEGLNGYKLGLGLGFGIEW